MPITARLLLEASNQYSRNSCGVLCLTIRIAYKIRRQAYEYSDGTAQESWGGLHQSNSQPRQSQKPSRTRIPPGRHGSVRVLEARVGTPPGVSRSQDSRAYYGARTGSYVPRALVRRPRQSASQSRLPHRDEQRHRPLQRWTALPSLGEPRHSEIPGVRTSLQEFAHYAAHGRRQGRFGFRPQGQERQRSNALLRSEE